MGSCNVSSISCCLCITGLIGIKGFCQKPPAKRNKRHLEHLIEKEQWILNPVHVHDCNEGLGVSQRQSLPPTQVELLKSLSREEGAAVNNTHPTRAHPPRDTTESFRVPIRFLAYSLIKRWLWLKVVATLKACSVQCCAKVLGLW